MKEYTFIGSGALNTRARYKSEKLSAINTLKNSLL